jgi:hypothetical protein
MERQWKYLYQMRILIMVKIVCFRRKSSIIYQSSLQIVVLLQLNTVVEYGLFNGL